MLYVLSVNVFHFPRMFEGLLQIKSAKKEDLMSMILYIHKEFRQLYYNTRITTDLLFWT